MSDQRWEQERARTLQRNSRKFADPPGAYRFRFVWGVLIGTVAGFFTSLDRGSTRDTAGFVQWLVAWALGIGILHAWLGDRLWGSLWRLWYAYGLIGLIGVLLWLWLR